MAALRTLWAALVSLYDETLLLVGGNVAWVVLNLPVLLVLAVIILVVRGIADDTTQWLLIGMAALLLLAPTPGGVALGGLARVAAGPDAPRFNAFWATLRARWRLSVVCSVVSIAIGAARVGNVVFYAMVPGVLKFVTIIWLYGALFWLGMHVYFVPLLLHVAEPRPFDLYRRAALIALGHPLYTVLVLLLVLALGLISVVFLPAYVLIAGAYVAMVQAHALREIRRRHGDLALEADVDDEVMKL